VLERRELAGAAAVRLGGVAAVGVAQERGQRVGAVRDCDDVQVVGHEAVAHEGTRI